MDTTMLLALLAFATMGAAIAFAWRTNEPLEARRLKNVASSSLAADPRV